MIQTRPAGCKLNNEPTKREGLLSRVLCLVGPHLYAKDCKDEEEEQHYNADIPHGRQAVSEALEDELHAC